MSPYVMSEKESRFWIGQNPAVSSTGLRLGKEKNQQKQACSFTQWCGLWHWSRTYGGIAVRGCCGLQTSLPSYHSSSM
jgi:hypothetical protein